MIDVVRFILDVLAFYSIYLMLSLSLNLEYGYTGIPNFGKVLFFAGGAFATGALAGRLVALLAGISLEDYKVRNILVATLATNFLAQNPLTAILLFFSFILLGAAIGALLGYLASYPAIRLREDYLGITLLVSGELARVIAKNYDPLICGTLGVAVPNPFAWAPGHSEELVRLFFMLSLAALSWIFVERLTNSPFGRMLKAVRDCEVAASSLGKDVVKVRMQALVIGSAIAGAAGALYAFYMGSVHADDYTPVRTFIVWVMVVLGGAGNNTGAALGALAYVLLDRVIAIAKHSIYAPFDVNYLSYILLGVLLIVILMRKPEGLIPEVPGRTLPAECLERIAKEKREQETKGCLVS